MTSTRSPFIRFGLWIAAAVFLLDQLVKWVVMVPLSLRTQPQGIIDLLPIFRLHWAENCGISLSLFSNCSDSQRWMLVAITAAVAIAVAVWMTREKAKADVFALALVLGGAVGNIVDRIRHGFVVDYADLHFGDFSPFLIFNVADAGITLGVLLLVARALLIREKAPAAGLEAASE
jgi:signal peptidase II